MSLVRNIDVEGRIVLPIELRKILKIDRSCDILIEERIKGIGLFIQRNYCVFCESTSRTTKFKGQEVCRSCIDNIVNEARLVPELAEVVEDDLASPAIIKMRELLKKRPDIKQHEMAKILGVSKPRVSRLMKKIRQIDTINHSSR